MQKKSINRYRSFCRSLDNLADAGLADADNKFVLSGTVQMFHLSFELSWKVMKDVNIQYHGVSDFATGSPRETLQTAKSTGLISDDIWMENKLERELGFMEETGAAFVFTAYEFGDERAVRTGKVVNVPKTLSYRQALSRTVIFTSTVLFDLEKINRELIKMPNVPSEDTATWWKALRHGYTAYGLNEALVVYRRPERSLSSNKGKAIVRIWNLYRRVEKLSVACSLWNFVGWAWRAAWRRL